MKYLAVKDFARFQHYSNRNPPWIKLYGTVLSDAAFLQMPEAAQAQLIKLWILASQLGHPLPNNPKLLAGRIGAIGRFHLATMISLGFIIPCEQIASASLAESSENATASVRADAGSRQSTEGEIELEPSSAAEAEAEATLALMLETDADRNALTALAAKATNRLACLTALTSMLTGNDSAVPRPTPRIFGQALRDMVTNDVQPTARKIRNYIADAARPSSAAPSGPVGSGNGRGAKQTNPGAQMVANILGGHGD